MHRISRVVVVSGFILIGSGSAARADDAPIVFENANESLGISGMAAGNAAWGDYDHDGWVDVTDGANLWRNEGGKRFVKVEGSGLSYGSWVDFDNDGHLDFYMWPSGKLMRNKGDGTFEDVSGRLPERPMANSRGAAWADFNNDGFLDLYLGGYEEPGYLPDALYFSEQAKSFRPVALPHEKNRPARGITAADYDNDGDVDIYVSNYRLEPNLLWRNDGSGAFPDARDQAGVDGDDPLGAWGHTIGSSWGDLDNDGDIDLFAGNFSHPADYQDRPKFYENLGSKEAYRFKDHQMAGMRWQESYAHPTLGDFDNDGLLDLFFTCVYSGDKPVLYRNNGDWTFTEVTAASKLTLANTYQGAWADFDNDGDLDLLTGGVIHRNPGNGNHWLRVRLDGGSAMNRNAIGAIARVRVGDRVIARHVESTTGEGSQNDMTLHFGLGGHDQPVPLIISWPNGDRQEMVTPVNRLVKIAHP
ncbi:MAG: hypothetical protein CMJ18_18610 [Phycisphaeraceae bacterium]|nr:hypothetical protein [Phycisphaeraceae bacterium]